ncbi:hypothetical protein PR048_008299 [Dryococelus australis]|uniref:Uncharacterized protein n=1 Tax=Dryococelus australis TaxID=614101 RepID=A0ABQ9HWR1_9NEOP|nr:hypothetical protein PR048_008299 [Dryococelus australis]
MSTSSYHWALNAPIVSQFNSELLFFNSKPPGPTSYEQRRYIVANRSRIRHVADLLVFELTSLTTTPEARGPTGKLPVSVPTRERRCPVLPDQVKRGDYGTATECRSGGSERSPRKSRRPAISSSTIPTCENPGAAPAGNRPRFAWLGGEWSNYYTTAAPHFTRKLAIVRFQLEVIQYTYQQNFHTFCGIPYGLARLVESRHSTAAKVEMRSTANRARHKCLWCPTRRSPDVGLLCYAVGQCDQASPCMGIKGAAYLTRRLPTIGRSSGFERVRNSASSDVTLKQSEHGLLMRCPKRCKNLTLGRSKFCTLFDSGRSHLRRNDLTARTSVQYDSHCSPITVISNFSENPAKDIIPGYSSASCKPSLTKSRKLHQRDCAPHSHTARERAELGSAKEAMDFTWSEYWDMANAMDSSGGQAPCMLHASNVDATRREHWTTDQSTDCKGDGVLDARDSVAFVPTKFLCIKRGKQHEFTCVRDPGSNKNGAVRCRVHGHGRFVYTYKSKEATRASLTRTPSPSSLLRARRAVFPSVRRKGDGDREVLSLSDALSRCGTMVLVVTDELTRALRYPRTGCHPETRRNGCRSPSVIVSSIGTIADVTEITEPVKSAVPERDGGEDHEDTRGDQRQRPPRFSTCENINRMGQRPYQSRAQNLQRRRLFNSVMLQKRSNVAIRKCIEKNTKDVKTPVATPLALLRRVGDPPGGRRRS